MKKLSQTPQVPPGSTARMVSAYDAVKGTLEPSVYSPSGPLLLGPFRKLYEHLAAGFNRREGLDPNLVLPKPIPAPGVPLTDPSQHPLWRAVGEKLDAIKATGQPVTPAIVNFVRDEVRKITKTRQLNKYMNTALLSEIAALGALTAGGIGAFKYGPKIVGALRRSTVAPDEEKGVSEEKTGSVKEGQDPATIYAGTGSAASDLLSQVSPPPGFWGQWWAIPAAAGIGVGSYALADKLMDWGSDKVRDIIVRRRREKAKQEFNRLMTESLGAAKAGSLAAFVSSAADAYIKQAQGGVQVVTPSGATPPSPAPKIIASSIIGSILLAEALASVAAFTAARKSRLKGDPEIQKAKALQDAMKRLRMSRPITVSMRPGSEASITLPEEKYVPAISAPATAEVTMPVAGPVNPEERKGEFNLRKLGASLAKQADTGLGPTAPGGTAPAGNTPGGSGGGLLQGVKSWAGDIVEGVSNRATAGAAKALGVEDLGSRIDQLESKVNTKIDDLSKQWSPASLMSQLGNWFKTHLGNLMTSATTGLFNLSGGLGEQFKKIFTPTAGAAGA